MIPSTNQKLLGKGTFAEVWSLDDTYKPITFDGVPYKPEEMVAKIYAPNKFEHFDWLNEVALLRRLNHKSIIKVLLISSTKAGECKIFLPRYPFNLTQYSSSKYVGDLINPHILAKDLCSAIMYLDDEMVVHGDIKPDNVLVDLANKLFILTDFGTATTIPTPAISKFVRVYKTDKPIGHTPTYTAPELKEEDTRALYSISTDIYSVGVTLMFYLLGSHEFDKAKTSGLSNFSNDTTLKPQHKNFIKLVRGMINNDPSERWDIDEIKSYYHKHFSVHDLKDT